MCQKIFRRISDAKLKEGIFVGPQIRNLQSFISRRWSAAMLADICSTESMKRKKSLKLVESFHHDQIFY